MSASEPTTFGPWLRQRRRALDITQAELARQVGYAESTLRKIEADELRPSKELAVRLAERLGIASAEHETFVRFARGGSRGIVPPVPVAADAVPGPIDLDPSPRDNLPVPLTSFVGREVELGTVSALLADTHLLTLTGTGGCGKTRLALQLAMTLGDRYPDGVILVELAPVADPAAVPLAIARALSLREVAGEAPIDTIARRLVPRHALLVVDNCEHLIPAAAETIEVLLRRCPRLTILATSREVLRVAGEVRWRVPSLAVPDADNLSAIGADPSALGRFEAVRLFVDRARAILPPFALTADNARAVAQICRRLEGMPLALELAAARLAVLDPDQIARRLDDQFRLLTGGARTVVPRHQTLRATIDWSHDLLTEPERQLFRRLAVFAGGFPLDAAEQVCGGGGMDSGAILDLLGALVEKSLVQIDRPPRGGVRYRLLDPLRQYGWERLVAAGEGDAVRDSHRDWCLALVARRAPGGVEDVSPAWIAQIEPEQDNMRAALAWCLERDVETGLRLAVGLHTFWWHRGFAAENERWVDNLLTRATAPTESWFQALYDSADHARDRGDLDAAIVRAEEGLRAARGIGDNYRIGSALVRLGSYAIDQGNPVRGCALVEEGLALFRQFGSPTDVAGCLGSVWGATYRSGDYERARDACHEMIELSARLGDPAWVAFGQGCQGAIAFATGEVAAARVLLEKGVGGLRAVGHRPGLSYHLASLGHVVGATGDDARARALLGESLALLRDLGHRDRAARTLCFLGILAIRQGAFARGVRFVGAAEAIYRFYRATLDPSQRADLDARIASAREALGEDACATAWTEGGAKTLDVAVTLALSEDEA